MKKSCYKNPEINVTNISNLQYTFLVNAPYPECVDSSVFLFCLGEKWSQKVSVYMLT